MTPRPDLHLRERRPRLCRLTPAEVDYLHLHHANILALAPTARRHVWRITPAGVAGALVTPWRRVVISPKLPICNLLFLLDPRATFTPDQANPADGRAVLDLLAALFAQRLDERLAAGLHRGYRERESQGPYLVGRLDVPAQLRQAPGRADQLHCRHDDFTTDLPCNQLPRAIAVRLAASPLLGEPLRGRLARALAGLEGISDVPVTPALDAPAPPGYGPLLDLCLLLVNEQAPSLSSGQTSCPSLLVSLERLFEQYVTRTIEEAFADDPGARVEAQQSAVVSEGGMTVRPDVCVRRGESVVVVDAKWKALPPGGLIAEDAYQALAYGTLLGARRTILVYPGVSCVVEHAFAHTALRLEVRALVVGGPLERCRRARARFQRAIRAVANWP